MRLHEGRADNTPGNIDLGKALTAYPIINLSDQARRDRDVCQPIPSLDPTIPQHQIKRTTARRCGAHAGAETIDWSMSMSGLVTDDHGPLRLCVGPLPSDQKMHIRLPVQFARSH